MPKLPERIRKDKGRPTSRPFSSMAASGLAMGLSWRDMRRMKYTHLMQLLWEWEDMHGADASEVVDAGDEEVMALARL